MKTSPAKQANNAPLSQSTRILTSAILLLLVTAFVTGCATYYTKKFSGISRTYESWAKAKIGTTKIFKGTIQYGGKDFPVEIRQRLRSVDANYATLDVTRFVAGIPVAPEKAFVASRDYGPSDVELDIVQLIAEVPPSGSARKTVFSAEPVDGLFHQLVFEPRQKVFFIDGKDVKADRYTWTLSFSSGSNESKTGWFSPEIPGGWVAFEKSRPWAPATSAQSNRTLVKNQKFGAKEMFVIGERMSLRLVSVKEP